MEFTCKLCNTSFPKNQGLLAHLNRKTPCTREIIREHTCTICNKSYTRHDSLLRHRLKPCSNKKIEQLKKNVDEVPQKQNTIVVSVNNCNITNVTNINITPWSTSLALTDSDVEATLARIPGLARSPELSEIVDVLMSLIKKAHSPIEARNIYLSPKRSDQALALTTEGWAVLPLSEATAAMFDGASARIEAKPMTSSKVSAIPPRIRSLKVEVPMHYRREKEEVVKMGLKPMEAHLLNTRPGGPGPLIQSNENAAAMPAIPQPLTNQDKLKTSLLDLPMRCGPSGAVLVGWIVEVSQATGLTGQEIFQTIAEGAKMGGFLKEWAAVQIYQQEKSRAA